MSADADLVASLLRRDPAAWQELLARHGGLIEACCQRVLAGSGRQVDEGTVADLSAEVIRALLEDGCKLLRRYRPETPLAAYLSVIARTRALNALRGERSGLAVDPALPSGEPSQAEILEAAERAVRLREALAALPSRDADALRLFHLEGIPYAEIARRLGIPSEQVGPLLFRAREKLREALGKNFPESA